MEIILSHPERINLFTQSFPGFFFEAKWQSKLKRKFLLVGAYRHQRKWSCDQARQCPKSFQIM